MRAAIVGGSGYGGRELLRILLGHPRVEVASATSRRFAGTPVADLHEALEGLTSLRFTDASPAEAAAEADCVFFALPHGEAAARMQAVVDAAPEVRVVDLSGDFRLRDAAVWEAAYGREHPAPGLLGGFTYGLSEQNRERIRAASRVANPGCFATAAALALLPLAEEGLLPRDVALFGVTGSSGSGAEPRPTTHHPERAEDFRAYRPLRHQHVPEVEATLAEAGWEAPSLAMVPHSAPFVRGIFVTAWILPERLLRAERLSEIYEARYGKEPFVRMRSTTPRVAVVRGTNFCDVAVTATDDGRRVVVMSAVDNLVKGMAGQAVQNMNLMFGFPEEEGLR